MFISCILVIFKASDVHNKQLSYIFLSSSYSAKNNTENDTNLNDGQTDWTLIAKNNTEDDMNLNNGQTNWTLIAAICIPIVVVVSFVGIIFYIRKTSKLYRFTTKL